MTLFFYPALPLPLAAVEQAAGRHGFIDGQECEPLTCLQDPSGNRLVMQTDSSGDMAELLIWTGDRDPSSVLADIEASTNVALLDHDPWHDPPLHDEDDELTLAAEDDLRVGQEVRATPVCRPESHEHAATCNRSSAGREIKEIKGTMRLLGQRRAA